MRTTHILVGLCLTVLVAKAQTNEQNRLLTKDYQPQSIEQALISLTAINRIGSSVHVHYKAGQSIALQPGFEAKAGSVFTAHIGAVSPLASGEESMNALQVSAYPNPFDQLTTISYVLPRSGRTSLSIRDAAGNLMAQLIDNQYQQAGSYQLEWKGANLPAGAYVYILENGTQHLSKRIIRK